MQYVGKQANLANLVEQGSCKKRKLYSIISTALVATIGYIGDPLSFSDALWEGKGGKYWQILSPFPSHNASEKDNQWIPDMAYGVGHGGASRSLCERHMYV